MEAKDIKEIEHSLYCKIMIPYGDKKVYWMSIRQGVINYKVLNNQ